MNSTIEDLRATESIYETLRRVAETVPGWTPTEQLFALYVASALDVSIKGDIVEVGSWCGRSTIALALAAKHSDRKLHTVDIFPERGDWVRNCDGTWSIRTMIGNDIVEACTTQTVWNDAFESSILPVYGDGLSPRLRLERALEEFGLNDIVSVHRSTGPRFRASEEGLCIGFLFLDGDHSESVVRADIEGFLPMMQPGGVMCFDDAFTVYDGVDTALTEALIDRVPPVMKHGRRLTKKMYAARLIK